MKTNNWNEYLSPPKSNSKPYERKICLNKVIPKSYFTENNIDNLEDNVPKKLFTPNNNFQTQTQNDNRYSEGKNLKQFNFTEEFKINQTDNSDNIQNNFEYNSQEKNSKQSNHGTEQNFDKKIFQEINTNNDNISFQNKKDIHFIKKDYQTKYIKGDNNNEINNESPKYNYKYKYKKFQKDEKNIEYDDKDKEDEEQNEEEEAEEESKEDKENIDLQELKKKPGKILHKSVMETYDEEGNRIVTTKTIQEFRQNTPGFRIKNVHQSKEKKEYERHTTNMINNNNTNQKIKERKTNLSHKNRLNNNHNRGDKIYLLAQLAKIKNDSEKKKKNRCNSNSISPIIIHESNRYENQNSIFSHEMLEPNSFDRETYKKSNYNFPNNYGRINLNNDTDNNEDRYYYPNAPLRQENDNNEINEEYFMEKEYDNFRNNAPSPIGYIATYSSGSEDNEEEIGKSQEQYKLNYTNYLPSNSKIRYSILHKNENKNKKEGELVKKTEITYEMEDPNDYIYNKKMQNLSGLEIKAQIDTSKSDKKDFQSPDKTYGSGADKFRRVTMAMITSLGPTCEDRKITRKIRNEIGGVVDLSHELNPVNNYKIKKVKRFGLNLKKEINIKTKIECARIIQRWWKLIKEKKNIGVKIIKIQSNIRGFLIRNHIIKSTKIFCALEIIKNLFYKRHFKELIKLLKNIFKDKSETKLARLINKLNSKNRNQKLIKYFFKYKFITNLLSKQSNYKEITNETKITEEMYINYIKEKYIKSNISQHINELSIKEEQKKENINEKGTGTFPNEEGINNIDINYTKNKKEFKDSETIPIKTKIEMTSNNLEIKSSNKNQEQIEELPKQNIKYELSKNEDFNIIDIKPDLEIEHKEEYNILKSKKEYKDEEIQKKLDTKEQGNNPVNYENKIIKNENIKLINKKKETAEKGISSNSLEKASPKKICKNEKISYINKIKKVDKGQQMDKKYNIIKKNESLNIISKNQRKKINNLVKRSESFKIVNPKKNYQEKGIQYIPVQKNLQNQTCEILRDMPDTKDNFSQYISPKSTICQSGSYSILKLPQKKISFSVKKNNFSIIKKIKITKENGEQCEIENKIKTKEIKIGNNLKRIHMKKLYELIEKIWNKKQKRKFINNLKSKMKEETMKKELLRMALLKWRFIKGYGGDRYGNIYDRNGKKIGEKEGEIRDISIQNTLEKEINDESLKKNLQIKISKQNPLYIKSNINLTKNKMIDSGTGDGVNHILNEKEVKIINLMYSKKPKGINKISGKNYFKINKISKDYKNQGTSMLPVFNKIVSENRLYINNDKFVNKQGRKKDLLLRIISKYNLKKRYKLYYYFTNWYKKTMRMINQERKRKLSITKPKIIKSEKFEIINKIDKREKSCGNIYIPNKVERASKVEFRQTKLKKDEGTIASFPPMFKKENLKNSKINNDIYKSKKIPMVLQKAKIESSTILGSNKKILTKEEILELNKKRKEILYKLIRTRKTPESFLRKYFNNWRRRAQYLTLLKNAKIIAKFCKSKLNHIMAIKRWKKLSEKYLLKQRKKYLMYIIKRIKIRKDKINQLIRITALIRFYNQRAFIHKILMYWFLYSINAAKKRNQMKMLYENMLTTYVSMADDIFGKAQKNNPSVQDCMFEIIDTDKYQVKELEDVPMAKTYYSKKKEEKKVITNIRYINRDFEENKETTIYKEINKYYYPKTYNENITSNKRLNSHDNKKEELGKKINLSFNYNDSSIFDNKNSMKNTINYSPNSKIFSYKDYSQSNNIINNNMGYSLNNSSYSNNYLNTNDFSYKNRKGNSSYKIYNNNDTNISYNKISINNNIYSNIKKDDKDNVIYEGIYDQKRKYNNRINNSDNKDLSYNKYEPIKNYNKDNMNINLNKNYGDYNYDEKVKRNNTDLTTNLDYSNKIKYEEKPKYSASYHRRNEKNNKSEIK